MNYYVSRQRYYGSGELLVEVVAGGRDHANPDALVSRYPGEGQEYADPREAVCVAYAIAAQWSQDTGDDYPVAVGATCGMGIELEPVTRAEADAWAEQHVAANQQISARSRRGTIWLAAGGRR